MAKKNKPRPNLSRREFLKLSGVAVAGAILASCEPKATPTPTEAPPVATEGPTPMPPTSTVQVTARPTKWVQVPLRTAEQKAKGYFGGEAGQMGHTMAVCPADPNYLAIGIDTSGVYISKDGAKSWQLKRQGIMCNGVQSIAFDPRNHNILWAAGMNGSPTVVDSEGIYRSIDCGESWHQVRRATYILYEAQNEYFAFDPDSFDGTQCRTVYAATQGEGILRTPDAGQTWKPLPGFPTNTLIHAVILVPMIVHRLFVAADTGLFRSDNGGASFIRTGSDLPKGPVYGLAVDAKNPDTLFIAMGEEGIWRSTDGGSTFQRTMNGIPESSVTDHWLWLRMCVGHATSPFSGPASYLQVYADARWGGAFPYYSKDGGDSWHAPSMREPAFLDIDPTNPDHWWTEGLAVHPNNAAIAFQMTPVRKTVDGGVTWKYANDGVSGCRRDERTSIAFRPEDPKKMVFFHPDWGSALTTDGCDTFIWCPPPRATWIRNGLHTMHVGACDPTPGSRKLISAVGGWDPPQQTICVSVNDGQSWDWQMDTIGDYQFLAFHPQQPYIVYAGRDSDSLRSIRGGIPGSWYPLPYPIKAMFAGNGDIVYAPRQTAQYEWEVLRSMNRGVMWKPLPGKITTDTFTYREIDVDPGNPDRLYAAGATGVWVFDGTTWSLRNERNGLERNAFGELYFRSIAVDPTRPNVIYAGQNECWRGIARGIFRSTDYGDHWENISGNLGPDLTVWAITVSPHDGTVWPGTDCGNWKLPPSP